MPVAAPADKRFRRAHVSPAQAARGGAVVADAARGCRRAALVVASGVYRAGRLRRWRRRR